MSVTESVSAASDLDAAKQLAQAYKVDGVPRVFVNGKYYTGPELAGGEGRIMLVVDQMIAQARKEKS